MTTTENTITAPGVSDPQVPACGGDIVPVSPRSSSNDGQKTHDAPDMGLAPQEGERSSQPLRLCGGGEDGSQGGEDVERKEGVQEGQECGRGGDSNTSMAGPSTRSRPGPRCSKNREKREGEQEREESRSRDRDWRGKRTLVQKGSPERDRSRTRNNKREDDEDVELVEEEPPQPDMDRIQELTRVLRETRERALEATEPGKVKAIIRSVEVLRVADKQQEPRIISPSSRTSSSGRTPSTGRKRSRGREEEGEEEVESEVSDVLQDTTPPSPPQGKIKRRKDGSIERRGRPAKDPSHAGEFTAERLEEKRREKEDKRIEEVAEGIRDPEVKARSKRAEAVDRNALLILDILREAPTAEITQRGINAVEVIKKIASTSKNLNGAYVGALWRAAEDLTAYNLAMTARVQMTVSEKGEETMVELERLRRNWPPFAPARPL